MFEGQVHSPNSLSVASSLCLYGYLSELTNSTANSLGWRGIAKPDQDFDRVPGIVRRQPSCFLDLK